MRTIAVLLIAYAFVGSHIAGAKEGDIDEYKTRLQIRQLNPGISLDRETEIFLLHKTSPDLFQHDKDLDGEISLAELKAAVTKARTSNSYIGRLNDYRRGRQPIPDRPEESKNEPKRKAGEPEKNTVFILRRKFDQVSSLAFPGADDEGAAGAEFSYGRDNAASNTVWAARGIAALMFGQSYPQLDNESQRFESRTTYAAGPYVQFDRLSNSSGTQQRGNLDNLTLGLIGEAGLQNMSIGDAPVTNYLRIKGGVTSDFDGITKSWNIGGEWQPVSNALRLGAPVGIDFLRSTVTPTFKARAIYASIIGDTEQPIFQHNNQAFLVGPSVGLLFAPVKLEGYWPEQFRNMSLGVSYSLLQDLLSPATYNLFDAALTYFTDDSKTLGITLSYERGKIEETGASSDTFMAGLSLKLFQEFRRAEE